MLTKIEWVDHSVNPVRVKGGKVWPHGYHCTKVSAGCAHCYAEGLNIMRGTGLPFDGRKVEFYLDLSVFDKLPKKPQRVFVQSMGDLFHEDVPFDFLELVFARMAEASRHIFLVLTKRPDRLLRYVKYETSNTGEGYLNEGNVWLGVTTENQEQADKRIPILLQIPAAKRFVSMEPLLGPVDISVGLQCDRWEIDNKVVSEKSTIDWFIIGAESGPKRRECKIEDAQSIVAQCAWSKTPAFVKQLHIDGKLSKKMDEWPEDLRIQEFPS